MPKTKTTDITSDDVRKIRDSIQSVVELWDQLATTIDKYELESIPAQALNNKDIAIQRMESAVAGAFRGLAARLMEQAANVGKTEASKLAEETKNLSKKVAENSPQYKKATKKRSSRKSDDR